LLAIVLDIVAGAKIIGTHGLFSFAFLFGDFTRRFLWPIATTKSGPHGGNSRRQYKHGYARLTKCFPAFIA
jgi:hypothetical protein